MRKRPISPHLTAYGFTISSASSILGRLAGVYTYLISVFILILVAIKIQTEKNISGILTAIFNFSSEGLLQHLALVIFTFGSLFAFFLYLLAIIRHLIWDFGYFLDLKPSKIMGYGMFILSFFASLGLTVYMFCF